MNLSAYVLGCNACRMCEGGAYQLPPFLYAGSNSPKILVIAQNPGEIQSDEKNKWRFDLSKLVNEEFGPSAETIKTVYDVDFITSYGYLQMEKIFGADWLTTGKFMYTNAVRCRTVKNAVPSEEMITNCIGWTSQLPIPEVVVLMGKVAVKHFCLMVKKPELDLWRSVRLKREKGPTQVVTIPHYAAMRSHEDMDKAKDLFEKTLEEAGVIL